MERFGKYDSYPKIPPRVRNAVLERDHHRCIFAPCDEAIVDVHHVTWRSQGGQHIVENLVTLCPTHHREVHLHRYSPSVLKKLILVNDALFRLKQTKQKYPKRITSVNDLDLRAALKLYQESMPENERDEPQDIKRWIRECANQRKLADQLIELRRIFQKSHNLQADFREIPGIKPNEDEFKIVHKHMNSLKRFANDPESYERYVRKKIQRLEDYFWVHKKSGKIVGFVYYQYYYEYQHANRFYDILANLPHMNYYLMNTGSVGEGYHFKDIEVSHTMSILDSLCRGGLEDWVNSPSGFKVPAAIRAVDDILVHPERLYSRAELEAKQKELNRIRYEAIEKVGSGLNPNIKKVFGNS